MGLSSNGEVAVKLKNHFGEIPPLTWGKSYPANLNIFVVSSSNAARLGAPPTFLVKTRLNRLYHDSEILKLNVTLPKGILGSLG
jgi:hypothetical protein